MKITTNKTKLTLQDIQSAITAHDRDFRHKLKLKAYYDGKHAILGKLGRANTPVNNRIVSNFPAYISNVSTGFFIGNPVTYKSADTENLQVLLDIFKYNDESAHNLNLAEEASITGEAYEILYIDGESNIRFASLPSEEVILVCDSSLEENIICAIRHFRIYDIDGSTYEEFADVYDENKITHYSYGYGFMKYLSETPHYFDDVPIIEYANNRRHKGDFEDVLTLVDAYNMAQSLTLDDMQDFTDAFLLLTGMGGTDSEDVKKLRRDKVIMLDEGGGAQWLIKNINDKYVENIKTRLQKDIHKFAQIPDMSDDNFAGNASGVAIKYKLIGLEQVRSRKEREFKKGLQRRIELIGNILKLKAVAQIDFREIDMQFTANIPANIVETADVVSKLNGLVSQETLIGLLPFVTEPEEEVEKINGELRREIEQSDAINYPGLHSHDEQ